MANLTELQIHGMTVTWDEHHARKAKPCEKCGTPTKGRLKSVKDDLHAATVVCMHCFPALMFQPLQQIREAIQEAFTQAFGGQV